MPEITFDLGEPITWTTYGLFDQRGLVRQLTEAEAQELAKQHPEIRELLGNALRHDEVDKYGDGSSAARAASQS